jgi:hypothetical protein
VGVQTAGIRWSTATTATQLVLWRGRYIEDDSGASVGKRYARNDELGIPLAVTFDFQVCAQPPPPRPDSDSQSRRYDAPLAGAHAPLACDRRSTRPTRCSAPRRCETATRPPKSACQYPVGAAARACAGLRLPTHAHDSQFCHMPVVNRVRACAVAQWWRE